MIQNLKQEVSMTNNYQLRSRASAKIIPMHVIKKDCDQYMINNQLTQRVAFPSSGGIQVMKIQDIIRLEADGNYTHIYLVGDRHLIAPKTLGKIYLKLPSDQFIRCHQSHVINVNHIERINKFEQVITLDGTAIHISRIRKKELKKWTQNIRLF